MKRLIQWFRNGGFQKPPTPHLATVECEVGKTTLMLTRDGEVFAVLVLTRLTRNMEGTSAEFRDRTHFMKNTRLR